MKTKSKLLLFVYLGLVLLLTGVVRSDLPLFGRTECVLQNQEVRTAFVAEILPSVTDF